MPTLPWLWLSTACWVTGGEIDARIGADTDVEADTDVDTDTDADTDTDTEIDDRPIELLEITPAHGSNAGGDVVEIVLGDAVESIVEVHFGSKLAKVIDSAPQLLTVEVPAVARTGPTDVIVTSGARIGKAAGGFRYWADATGQTSALGEIGWWAYQGTYWGDAVDYGVGWFGFTEPTDADWGDLYGTALDTCARSVSRPTLDWRDPGVSGLVLDGTPFAYDRGVYESEAFGVSSLSDGGALDMDGAAGWPALEVPGFLAPISAVAITAPAVDGSFPDVVLSSFQVTWSGAPADALVLQMYRYEGDEVVDEVSCRLKDDGKFSVPSSVWSRWTSGDQVTIAVGRASFPEATLPFDNGRVRVATTWWSVGAVFSL